MSGPYASVSVVIPVYRGAATLERALRSVAAQTLLPAEVIVVDDASDDDTPERLAALGRQEWPFALQLLRLPENKGPGEARNAGWAVATGEWVAFLDADDGWLPEKLERQIGWMREHREFVWSAHRCPPLGAPQTSTSGRYLRATQIGLLWRNRVATSSVVLKRAVQSRFRPQWWRCEDFLIWQDLLAADCAGVILGETLGFHGRAPTSKGGLTGDLEAMHAAELQAIDLLYREGRLSAAAAVAWKTWTRLKYLRRKILR